MMMATLARFVLVSALLVTLTAAVLNGGGAPAERTNAPGNQTCLDGCHNTFTLNEGGLTFSITSPGTYSAGVPVSITVSFPGQASSSFGFEVSVHDGSGFHALDNPTVIDANTEYADGNVNYVTHANTGQTSWNVQWTPSASTPPASVTIYAAGVEGSGGNGNKQDYVYTATKGMTLAPLPVELAEFTGVVDGNDVELTWWTASESQNAGFEVQQMKPGIDARFKTIAFVNGTGTTSSRSDYSHQVDGLLPGRYFFRLRQIDFDGTATTSPQIEATIAVPGQYLLSPAYPNPFNPTTLLELTVERSQHVTVVAVDAAGRQVATLYDGTSTSNQPLVVEFDARELPTGLYVIRAQGETFSTSRSVTLLR
jgi:hypothetical protein